MGARSLRAPHASSLVALLAGRRVRATRGGFHEPSDGYFEDDPRRGQSCGKSRSIVLLHRQQQNCCWCLTTELLLLGEDYGHKVLQGLQEPPREVNLLGVRSRPVRCK